MKTNAPELVTGGRLEVGLQIRNAGPHRSAPRPPPQVTALKAATSLGIVGLDHYARLFGGEPRCSGCGILLPSVNPNHPSPICRDCLEHGIARDHIRLAREAQERGRQRRGQR